MTDAAEVLSMFRDEKLSPKQRHYLTKQVKRLADVLDIVEHTRSENNGKQLRILDISPHLLTLAIRKRFGRDVSLTTIGWFDESMLSQADVDSHVEFDLNDTNFKERWVNAGQHDLVIMGEIFEHLYACPRMTLRFARTLLAAPNGRLILQTPNAVCIRNRLKMVVGRNPFELIQPHRQGHVREYTMAEVCQLAAECGFCVEQRIFDDYLPERGVLRVAEKLIPSLQRRMTVVLSLDRTIN